MGSWTRSATRRRAAAALLVLACVALALPAVARATYVNGYESSIHLGSVGEANDLTITGSGGVFTIREDGGLLDPSGTCTATGPHEAVCRMSTPSSLYSMVVLLGDGDDRLQAAATADLLLSVQGGNGDDVLTGGNVGNGMIGGPGTDRLTGGDAGDGLDGNEGSDVLAGGGGPDTLIAGGDNSGQRNQPIVEPVSGHAEHEVARLGGGIEPDELDGGPGDDVVRHVDDSRPVTIDLNRPTGHGAAGENDTITDVEGAEGGGGDDLLIGTAGPNELVGDDGRDKILGAAGADEIRGGSGVDSLSGGDGDDLILDSNGLDWDRERPTPRNDRGDQLNGDAGDDEIRAGPETGGDTVSGGPGSDALFARNGAGNDRVLCGEGIERTAVADARDQVGADCEKVDLPLKEALSQGVAQTVSCPARCTVAAQALARTGLLAAARRMSVVGSARVTLRRAGSRTLRVKLSARARRAFRKRRSVTLTIRTTATVKGRRPVRQTQNVTLSR